MSRARALIEGTVTVLGTLSFAAVAVGAWIVLDPAPDRAAPVAHRATQQTVLRCPDQTPESSRDLSRDALGQLLARLEEGRP